MKWKYLFWNERISIVIIFEAKLSDVSITNIPNVAILIGWKAH